MNGKQAKKIRQYASRKYDRTIKEILEAQSNMFKPKPKFIPMFMWIWIIGFFIKIKSANVKKKVEEGKDGEIRREVSAPGTQVKEGPSDQGLEMGKK
jgi:hypothetical protein